jgi:hypothetical protein
MGVIIKKLAIMQSCHLMLRLFGVDYALESHAVSTALGEVSQFKASANNSCDKIADWNRVKAKYNSIKHEGRH